MPGDEPRGIEELTWDELYALLDDDDLDQLGELFDRRMREVQESIDRRHAAAKGEPVSNLTRPLPPLPPDVNLFLFSSIQKGARKFAANDSINGVAAATVFSLHDASRLHWMLERGFFRVDEGRLLPPDWRVGRVGKKYALRFLDEAAWKWMDPAATSRTPG